MWILGLVVAVSVEVVFDDDFAGDLVDDEGVRARDERRGLPLLTHGDFRPQPALDAVSPCGIGVILGARRATDALDRDSQQRFSSRQGRGC